MNIAEKRPFLPATENLADINKFISYLKGEKDTQESITLPNSICNSISKKLESLCPIRSLARVTNTSGDRLEVVVDTDEQEESGWVSNELIKIEEIMSVTKISIYLHELFAKPKVASSILEDHNTAVENYINDKITTQMAAAENKAFLFGDGKFQPKGILTYEISTDGDFKGKIQGIVAGAPGTLNNYEAIVKVMEALPSKYLSGASWIMSRNAASHIRTIQDETTHKFLWQNSIAHGVPNTLLGYPVTICDDMPKVTTEEESCVPVLFANLYEGYQIAEKSDISIIKDPYHAKPFVEFYATKRVGGDVVNLNAIKALVLKRQSE
jgi:HK97 family phage major capsid protein